MNIKEEAQSAFEKKDWASALDWYTKFKACTPDSLQHTLKLSWLLKKNGDMVLAREKQKEFQESIRTHTKMSAKEKLKNKILSHLLLGEKEKVKQLIQKAKDENMMDSELRIFDEGTHIKTGEFISTSYTIDFKLFEDW